ncbi:MAG: GTPase-associated protein 1-related protein, partial [Pseudonocardiaceae bacterium]
MSFQQLYYTSSEHGLSGHAGFQFTAVSDGVDPRIMRRVEQVTVYDRPSKSVEPGDEPVNLCHVLDEATGTTVTARVVYAGLDPSGRPGNYFAHALVSSGPDQDFGELRPVELWGSPAWDAEVAVGTSLPLLDDLPQASSLDRVVVAEFLAARNGSTELLAALLTAADRAVSGGRPVILRGATSEANAVWIAAVSYLLSSSRAIGMSFATYSRRPDRTRTHIVGTVPDPDSDAVTLGLTDSFWLFDLVDHRPANVEPHPLALLLAEAGPVQAAGLWQQAASLAAGDERGLQDWLPVVAAAHALVGRQPELPIAVLEEVARWLPSATVRSNPLPNHRAEAVLRVVLERATELPASELRTLEPVAQRTGAQDQLHAIDSVLLDRAMQALRSGRAPEAGLTPLTMEGSKDAARRCESILAAADADGALTVLDWACTAAAQLQSELVQWCGREVIGPALERLQADPRLERVALRNQPLLLGLAEDLVASTDQRLNDLFSGATGKLLGDADLTGFPRLHKLMLVVEVRQGRLAPLAALREMTQLRGSASPLTDAQLLRWLWPDEQWTLKEAARVLPLVRGATSETPVLPYLSRALNPPHDLTQLDDWLELVDQVQRHPVLPMLPDTTLTLVNDVAGMGTVLHDAAAAAERREQDWYGTLNTRIRGHSQSVQRALQTRFAILIINCPDPAAPLEHCPAHVFSKCCELVWDRLH